MLEGYSFRLCLGWNKQAPRIVAYHEDEMWGVGKVYTEDRNDILFLHYSLKEEHHRRGVMSAMVEMLIDYCSARGLTTSFCDHPDYLAWGGSGVITEMGQNFADGFRLKRGIPFPPKMWASEDHPAPGEVRFWGRKMIDRLYA